MSPDEKIFVFTGSHVPTLETFTHEVCTRFDDKPLITNTLRGAIQW